MRVASLGLLLSFMERVAGPAKKLPSGSKRTATYKTGGMTAIFHPLHGNAGIMRYCPIRHEPGCVV